MKPAFRLNLKKTLSLKRKLLSLFFLIAIVASSIIGFYGYKSASEAYLENAFHSDRVRVDQEAKQIENFMLGVSGDLQFLARFHALHSFWHWEELGETRQAEKWRQTTLSAFYSFMNSKPIYQQLRLLDHTGQEKIRIEHDKLAGNVKIVSRHELQDKSHQAYYLESRELKMGEIYVSQLELMMEHKKIVKPHVPTIRYITPLADDEGQVRMLIVLNVYAESFLSILKIGEDPVGGYFINKDGYYIAHPQAEKKWGFQLGHSHTLKTDNPDLFEKLQNETAGSLPADGRIFTFRKVLPLATEKIKHWFLIRESREDVVFGELNRFKYIFIAILVGIFLLSFLIAKKFTDNLLRPLVFVTAQLEKLSLGELSEEKLYYKGEDELSAMLASSSRLIGNIKVTIDQANRIAAGDYDSEFSPASERDQLGGAIARMKENLHAFNQKNRSEDWLKSGQNTLNENLLGVKNYEDLAEQIFTFLIPYVDTRLGALYVRKKRDNAVVYSLEGSYAYTHRKNLSGEFKPGEGLVGQCAREKKPILLTDAPPDYIRISSGVGESVPPEIYLMPLLCENEVLGVIELAGFNHFTPLHLEFLKQAASIIGRTLFSISADVATRQLLEEVKQSNIELNTQSEELQTANEELEEKSVLLKEQSEELQASNEELAEKSDALKLQNADVERKNTQIEITRKDIEKKARELETASKYKSEFLANMSHELRTPLNSLLILSRTLFENEEGNLNVQQIESAKIIYSGGQDLLNLINDILDLSKVEAGKLSFHIEEVAVAEICTALRNQFRPVAGDRGLQFRIKSETAPATLETDRQRVEQILKNLLSNAFKFTSKGLITLNIFSPGADVRFRRNDLQPEGAVAFSVTDTGIGIAPEKQDAIFEAFQQEDGSTSRKFGGTGLGLSISRELSSRLGGEIQMKSVQGNGSTFTLYLPLTNVLAVGAQTERAEPSLQPISAIRPETTGPQPFRPQPEQPVSDSKQKTILIIEDDSVYAQMLVDLTNKQGYKSLTAGTGMDGLKLAIEQKPTGIILDMGLPDMDGLKVLDRLKHNPGTRDIPVHIVSARNEDEIATPESVIGCLTKSADPSAFQQVFKRFENALKKDIKELLLVEDDPNSRTSIFAMLASRGIRITAAKTGEEAREFMRSKKFDCIVLDLELPVMSGFELLEELDERGELRETPIIVYTAKELDTAEYDRLSKYAESIVVKGKTSPERLEEEIDMFLHSVRGRLPTADDETQISETQVLKNKKVLLVDDDIRNTFALARALQRYELKVVMADNGELALEKLEQESDVDLVIMDIMMPVMDGYEAMRNIRKQAHFRKLPVIALTAKAMPEERDKCLDAGANDYLTKPVDVDRLVAMMKVWLFAPL